MMDDGEGQECHDDEQWLTEAKLIKRVKLFTVEHCRQMNHYVN